MSRGVFLYNCYRKLYSKKYNFPIGFCVSLACDFGVEANLVIKVWGARDARCPSFFVIRNNVTTNILEIGKSL